MFDPSLPRADEPFFTLLGRDPAAPHLLRAWAYKRMGQDALAQQEAAKANAITLHSEPQSPGDDQIRSAFKVADDMEAYFRNQATGGAT
jgi:hypothetical protein